VGKLGVVVLPADPVLIEPVEDRAVRGVGVRHTGRELGGHVAERSTGDEEPAVRIGLGHHRAEVAVADREVVGHRVVEGQVVAGPVAHRGRAARVHEAPVGAVVPADVRGVPGLAYVGVGVADRVRVVERRDVTPGGVGAVVDRLAVAPEGEPVAAAKHPPVVVEGVVLHHEHDDVLDLGHGVGAGRQVRERAGVRLEEPAPRTEALGARRRESRRGRGRICAPVGQAADPGRRHAGQSSTEELSSRETRWIEGLVWRHGQRT
jgi:hypothetical protein